MLSEPILAPRLLAHAIGAPLPSEEQERVIAAPLRSAVVLAGAGSGKTETIAARVVWLIANGLVLPEQVLGLTFTRSAARGLIARIRTRLAGFAASPLLERTDPTGRLAELLENSEPQVLTYDAYAGELVSRWGLLLGQERGGSASAAGGRGAVLSDAGMWQLAYATAASWEDGLLVDRDVGGVAEAVLALGRRMAEQLDSPARLTKLAQELQQQVQTLPPGPRQRAEPAQELHAAVAVQQARVALLGLVARVQERLAAAGSVDFAAQMALAARLADQFPQVRAAEAAARRVVLLDEYQDTGYAQRVMLSALFGTGGTVVMGVGDPHQAIYGWRGASAGNLAAFAEDFGAPGALNLMTSWRNPTSVLELANRTSEPLRGGSLDVPELLPRPQAPLGEVRVGLFEDVAAERAWIAEQIAAAWGGAGEETRPTTAVLVRRNTDAVLVAEALRAAGIPAQVIGLGGLLATPAVSELVAMLELVVNPGSSSAALQVLCGPRWRCGAADLVALSGRCAALAGGLGKTGGPHRAPAAGIGASAPADVAELTDQLTQILAADHSEQTGLGEALSDLGEPGQYSPAGYARLVALAEELAWLRTLTSRPLPEFVTRVERVIGVAAAADAETKERLAAFASVVSEHAKGMAQAGAPASPEGLLAYLRVAETVERGLPVDPVVPDPAQVQVLTVHAAKGLEWDVVAVAHLSVGVFPTGRARSTWVGDLTALPPRDMDWLTRLEDRSELQEALKAERSAAKADSAEEERRLGYVAVTRARRVLLLSGAWWGETSERPLGPSEFLREWRDVLLAQGGEPDVWAQEPAPGSVNPLAGQQTQTLWPADMLGSRRETVERGAELVLAALARPALRPDDVDDPDAELFAAARALLDKRLSAPDRSAERLSGLTVSEMVELGVDPAGFERRRARRGPRPPAREAQAGTSFHEWVRRWYLSEELIDLDDLPGAADDDWAADNDAAGAGAAMSPALRQAFLDSPWAGRSPVAVEAPFELNLGGRLVKGRIDAVFAEPAGVALPLPPAGGGGMPPPGGGFIVVDWKTGRADIRKARVQLSVYRLAWQRLMVGADGQAPPVKGVVHEIATGVTREFEHLLSAEELVALLAGERDL